MSKKTKVSVFIERLCISCENFLSLNCPVNYKICPLFFVYVTIVVIRKSGLTIIELELELYALGKVSLLARCTPAVCSVQCAVCSVRHWRM